MGGLSDKLQALLDAHVARDITGASLALRVPGEPEIRLAAGCADRRRGAPFTPEHLVKAASCGKTFTAAAVIGLVAEGAFDLDQPIERWFPDLPLASRITLRSLLDHRSGLPEFEDRFDDRSRRAWTPDEIVDFAMNTGRQTEPGRFAYNNTGYVVAGMILERETGESYSRLLRRRFFEPLGLDDTFSASGEAFPRERLARCYMHDGEPPIDSTEWFAYSAINAAGDLISTPSDLVRWLDALFAGRVVPEPLLGEMTRNLRPAGLTGTKITHNGPGILASRLAGGLVVKGHLGQLRGAITMMAYHEPSGIALALSQNSGASEATDARCTAIHDTLAELFRAAGARPDAQGGCDAG